jgi:hypothetical protein
VTETAVIPAEDRNAEIAAQVVVKGDLAKLTEPEKMAYYTALCRSLGLNPLTRPFEFITLNGKLTLYAKRDAADQLRRGAKVTITGLDKEQVGDLLVVTAYGRTPDGREDAATGAVSVRGLAGEALANAMMKAETKAKRRLTLSLVGLGFPTEEEVEDIPPAEEPPARKTLAERVAERAAALDPASDPSPDTTTDAAEVEGTFVEAPAEEPPLPTEPQAQAAPATTPASGLSAAALGALAVQAGKTKGEIAVAIGSLGKPVPAPTDVTAVVKAMTDAERGQLADALNLDWRPAP